MDSGLKLCQPEKGSLSSIDQGQLGELPYHSLVGCLIYFSVGTCPDITYAVQQLSQFLNNFSFTHWNAAIQVVHYLKGAHDLYLRLGGDQPILLRGFTDSDWANCLDTRRSVGGYLFSLGSVVILWSSRKQKTVATLSCEVEYMAAFESSKEAIWLCTLLSEIGMAPAGPTMILCNKNVAIVLLNNPLLHSRSKHFDIHHHFLHE